MSAPVCHIPPEDVNIPQPTSPGLPGIPVATDLASALRAINAIRQTLQIMNSQQNNDNGFGRRPEQGKKSQWSEESRVTSKVKIYQNNDPSTGNFVEVEQINKLVMADKNTGQKWTWNRDR